MSQEYNKILRYGPQLSKAFQSHLPALPSALLKKHLITGNNVAEVNNIHVGLPHCAAKLLGFIRNKVSLNKDCYYEFVDALKEDEDDQFNDILLILGEAPKPAANRQQNGKETNGSSHAPPKAATVVFHDIHGEERPRFSEADMKEILQSKEPQNEPSTYRAEIESYVSKVLVLIHTVKEEELVAVYKYLKPPIDGFKHTIKYYATREMSLILGKFGNRDAAVVQTEKSVDCADDIRNALKSLPNVKLIIGVGFAYGKKGKCKFGDVLVSKVIYDVKSTRLEKEGVRPEGGHACIDMDRVVNVFVRGTLTHKFESVTADPVTRKPKVIADTIMSGPNLVNNPQNVGDILKHDARSVGGEMEGNVVAKCVRSFCKENEGREIDYVIIKGVADYGDGTKGKPWQFTASLAAANYADHRLEKEGGKVYYLTVNVPSSSKKKKVESIRSSKSQVAAPGPVNQISNNQAEHGTATTNEVTNQVAAPGPLNQISNNQAEHGTATTNEVTNQETPRFSNADVSEIEEENKPQGAPADRQEEIQEYLSKVVVLLHTVKKEELIAVYKYIKPPMNGFENAVKFPLNERMSIVLGKFGNRDAALLQTEKSEECKDKIRVALNRLQNVQLVIGVGFAYGRRGKCEFGDVLVSKVIYGVKTIRVEDDGIKLEGGHVRNDMRRVIEVFATGPMTHKLASVTVGHQRKPKVLADTIMSSIMLVNHPRRVVDVLKHDTRSIGGEMEGKAVADCVLSYLDDTPRREIDFVIIKGVADFGDGTKGKPWQVTASFAAARFAEDKLKKTDFYRLAGGQ